MRSFNLDAKLGISKHAAAGQIRGTDDDDTPLSKPEFKELWVKDRICVLVPSIAPA